MAVVWHAANGGVVIIGCELLRNQSSRMELHLKSTVYSTVQWKMLAPPIALDSWDLQLQLLSGICRMDGTAQKFYSRKGKSGSKMGKMLVHLADSLMWQCLKHMSTKRECESMMERTLSHQSEFDPAENVSPLRIQPHQ